MTPILSVLIPTYNHEKYIVQALDSVLMQKTQYNYEILVGDDASTDKTQEILKKYEKQHPGKIIVFYREHNLSKEDVNNFGDLINHAHGRYIIFLEGDDFWLDPYKIEKQVSFLETHKKYLAVAHNCLVVGDDALPNGENYPECHDNEYSLNHLVNDILPGQTATFMYRAELIKLMGTPFHKLKIRPGDRKIYFTIAAAGKIYCIQERMTAYRHVTNKGSSFSATYRYNYDDAKLWHLLQLKYAFTLENKKALKCAEILYMKTVYGGFRHSDISIQGFFNDIMPIPMQHRFSVFFVLAIKFLCKKLFTYNYSIKL